MTMAAVDLGIEEKLDAIAAQVASLARDAEEERLRRARWGELASEAMPIVTDAMQRAAAELEDAELDPETLLALGKRLAASAATMDRFLVSLQAGVELVDEISGLSRSMLEEATSRLAVLEQRGYLSFARAGAGVVDEVIANFSEADVQRLGENVVLILNVVKDLTQPEILGVVRRMIGAVERQRLSIDAEPEEAPTVWQLMRKMRDPEVRRGMSRALDTLRAVTEADGVHRRPDDPQSETEDNGKEGA